MDSTLSASQLPLAPLGAGDLIDRAVRLYRRHLFVLIRTAAPPVIIVAVGWILFSISVRRVFLTDESQDLLVFGLLWALSVVIMLAGYLSILVVMGGATRTLVAHLLRNDPVTTIATYAAVRSRFWGLFVASLIVFAWISASFIAAFVAWEMVIIGFFMISMGLALAAPAASWVSGVIVVIGFVIASALAILVFFFMVARIAYVYQVMLVEGKGVFEALGRSFSLAKGNVLRLLAMTIFTFFAANSALMILMVPLGWYGYLHGIDFWNSAQWPTWYAVAYSSLGPLSSILLTPIWMLGLSLLYMDERVRHEGYDIELMASRQLGEVPDVNVSSPLGTALYTERTNPPPAPGPSGSATGPS
jgi:hypothetical protein